MILALILWVNLARADIIASADGPAAVQGDLFSQDPSCTDYHQGCMRITWQQWRTPHRGPICHESCYNPCRFSGMTANANAKPSNFNPAECEQQCALRQPVTKLLKPHEGRKPKCIVIHHGGEPARDLPPIRKEQSSYDDAMVFDTHRGDGMQKAAGGKCQWGDPPYHYQIDQFGNLIEGRSPEFQPDTNTRGELDTDGKINIVVDGDYRTNASSPTNRLSPRQLQILIKTINYLKHKYGIRYVTTHMWLAHTDCPGDDVVAKLKQAGVLTGCPDDKFRR